jgi:hypothetical protein
VAGETTTGDRVRAGVSEAIDGGQTVIALFSVVDSTDHNIRLMPPQVQLGGRVKSGKIIRRSHWATADQLPVTEFRLGKRRLGPGERADGVVLFERPPCPYNTRIVPTRTLIQDHDRGLSWLLPTSPRPPSVARLTLLYIWRPRSAGAERSSALGEFLIPEDRRASLCASQFL